MPPSSSWGQYAVPAYLKAAYANEDRQLRGRLSLRAVVTALEPIAS